MQENDIQLSKDNVQLRKENLKLSKQYLDLKSKTETAQDIEESDFSGSISTGTVACLSVTAIGLVGAAFVMNDSWKRKSEKGSMYLIDKEEIWAWNQDEFNDNKEEHHWCIAYFYWNENSPPTVG